MRMGSASSPPALRTRSRRPTSSAASSAQAGECPRRASTSSATGTAPASRDGRRASTRGFVRLPAARYDVIWSSGCLHHVVNLESLFAEVERALRDGGLFAVHDYVGERRMQFAPERLARINALLREVPARYRPGGTQELTGPPPYLSPFCAVRSDEILGAARARFEVVHEGKAGALFPLFLLLD